MAYNDSSFGLNVTDGYCILQKTPNANYYSMYYSITLVTCVISALFSPMVIAENALILFVLWRNPTFKTPSYVMLGCLAFSDLCTGLVTQPAYVIHRVSELRGHIQVCLVAGVITEGVNPYFAGLTAIATSLMAVERWLYMSKRSCLTVRRTLIAYFAVLLMTTTLFGYRLYNMLHRISVTVLEAAIVASSTIVFGTTALAYYKVLFIIRQHQIQVQVGQAAIDVAKYRKSCFTILYIMLLFVLSYAPYAICQAVLRVSVKHFGRRSTAALNSCLVFLFMSSFLNPLLYFWRIKEIRSDVKTLLRNFFPRE